MKKNLRFFWVSVFLSVLPCFLFSGCSNEPSEPVVVFSVGGAPAELDFWQKLIADFQQQSGIKVDLLRQPTDTDLRRQQLVTPLKSGKDNPDVFLMDVAWIGQFAASGYLTTLEKIEADIQRSNFFEKVITSVDTYQGKLIAMPVYVDGGLLYYRRDLLEKYGYTSPPSTWQQLVDMSEKIQKKERRDNPKFYGYVFQGAQYEGLVCNWLEVAASNGGGIIKNSLPVIDSSANLKATTLMHDMINKYKISPANTYTEMKEEEVRMWFQNGDALFERNWPYAWNLHNQPGSPVKGKAGIAKLPSFDGHRSAATLGGWHVGVSAFSDVKQQAFELVKFIISYKTQKQLVLNLGWNPARKDVYKDKQVTEKLPHLVKLADVFENLTARPNLPFYTIISEDIQRNLNAALAGNITAKEALSKSQEKAKEIILRYGQ